MGIDYPNIRQPTHYRDDDNTPHVDAEDIVN